MKVIQEFVSDGSTGLALRLDDARFAVSVARTTGDVLLNEGKGRGRLHGVCIPGKAVEGFSIRNSNGKAGVYLSFRNHESVASHLLGLATDCTAAADWVSQVNKVYNGDRPGRR